MNYTLFCISNLVSFQILFFLPCMITQTFLMNFQKLKAEIAQKIYCDHFFLSEVPGSGQNYQLGRILNVGFEKGNQYLVCKKSENAFLKRVFKENAYNTRMRVSLTHIQGMRVSSSERWRKLIPIWSVKKG